MFRQINIMFIRGAQRNLYEAPLCCNKNSLQQNSKTIAVWSQKKKQKTVATKEASAFVVSGKSENGCFAEKQLNSRQQMSTGPHNITEYSQTPLWRPSIPCVPMPCHRGPLVLQKEATKVDSQIPKDDTKLKLNRRDYLRQMYKDNRMNLIEKKAATDMQMDSTKSTKEFLNPARLEFVNLKWKERQEEIEKRQQETDKKYVSRFEMNAGRKERII